MARGMPPQAPVRVAIEVSKPGERLLTCSLVSLEERLQEVGCKGCAVILVTWPEVAVPAVPAAETCAA
jgi:uroporphyrin-III C-methyltransferase/precorrin-2 dehydrogenase/sirohydrochlorin ferrochelatase